MKHPPDPILTPLAVTSLVLAAASTGTSVGELVTGANAAEQAGKEQQKAANRSAAIRAAEARDTRRQLVARAQAMGAASGATVGDTTLAQIGREVDTQAAYDIWSIRQRGVDAQNAANQQAYGLRAEAAQTGLSGGAKLVRAGMYYHNLGVPGFGGP